MSQPRKENLAILVIDMQREYFEKGGPLLVPDGPAVLENVKKILDAGRANNTTIVHVRHFNKDPNRTTFNASSEMVNFLDDVEPFAEEKIVTKNFPSAFYETDLDNFLLEENVETVAITGLMSFMCCDTTAREAHARGYKVLFLSDATAAIPLGKLSAQQVHDATCEIQDFLFSKVISTDELLEHHLLPTAQLCIPGAMLTGGS